MPDPAPDRPSDRRILALAVPALGALAAEPLYLLVDTAVIGHLGTAQLAGLAVGGALLANVVWLMSFLAYGTTGRAARLYGAGRRADAVDAGVQATWLGVALGLLATALLQLLAEPLAGLVAGPANPETRELAVSWLRIASLGAPFVAITLAGQGWMRGVQDLRRPLYYLIGANAFSAALAPVLVYPAGLGLEGSAVANVVAQAISAALFLRALRREGASLRPRLHGITAQLSTARDLGLRTIALQGVFLSATATASRLGPEQVAAHLIAIQLWFFLALVLDAFAIAAQALVGELLGAGRVAAARGLARRVCELGAMLGGAFAALILGGWTLIPRLFTGDAAVLDAIGAAWLWFGMMQPVAGVAFAIDGILMGAGDVRVLRNLTLAAVALGYLPGVLGTLLLGLGLTGIWVGLTLFVVLRVALGSLRLRGTAWSVAGATA